MKNKNRALAVIVLLIGVQLACNSPGQAVEGAPTRLPAPNQTLTALFSITPRSSSTPTLPPIATATRGGVTIVTATLGGAATQAPPRVATATTGGAATTRPPAVNPTATNTRPAQPTATIPSIRPRSPVVAKYLNTPPNLDGDWSEWKENTTEYPANLVVWGKNNWLDETDLSSSFHIGWDDNNLYIAVKVRDDVYVQNATGADIYKGDGLELLLDTNLKDDFYSTQLSPDDFQLGISPGRPDPNGDKSAYLWFPSNIAGARGNVKIGARLETGIYRVEAAIPWSVIEVSPGAGKHFGFAISVNDNDDPNNNLQQSMVSNVSGRQLTDPTTWGDLQLVR